MTLAGFFALFFILVVIINRKAKAILDPMFYLLFIFLFFFGIKKEAEISEKTEIILLLNFVIFFSSVYISRKFRYRRIISFIDRKDHIFSKFYIKPLSSGRQFMLFLIVVLYVLYDFSFNTWLYGSFELAFTRFYYRLPDKEDIPTYLSIIQFSLYSVSSLILFVLSYNNAKFKTSAFFVNITFLALALVAFPRGTRGAIISLFVIIVLARLIANQRMGKKIISGSLFSINLFFPFIMVMFVFVILSTIRNKEIDNLAMLQSTITNMNFSESQAHYNETESDLLLKDVNKTVETFGTNVSFLPLTYTLKAVIFNPVPRSLWKKKPVGFGVALTEVKMGGHNFDTEYLAKYTWSNAAGVAGEGWANEGVLGVILYSFLMGIYAGLLLKIVDRFLLSDNYVSLSIALLCFLASLLTVRGDILSGITQGLYPILFFMIILTLLQPFVRYRVRW